MTVILSNPNRFTNFFTGRFLCKFAVKWILKIPSHLAYVATLPCETLMSAKQAINDTLQGSVVTYLRNGRVVNDQIKTGLLMSVRVKKLKSVNIWQSYKQECGCLMHFARLANTLLKGDESARDNHVFACNFAKLDDAVELIRYDTIRDAILTCARKPT